MMRKKTKIRICRILALTLGVTGIFCGCAVGWMLGQLPFRGLEIIPQLIGASAGAVIAVEMIGWMEGKAP